ncbi:MAG TPA: hypothetical protein PKZ24_03830 [Nitrospirales bacterium]|nr:hypothetical protein [Nitrospirales bacterium]
MQPCPISGLDHRVDQAKARLTNCQVCPRHCGIDRVHGERGTCLVGAKALGQRLR